MSLTIVTSFNKDIWENHGRKCVVSWLDHLVGEYTLHLYIDGPIPNDLPLGNGINVFLLDNDKDYVKFLKDTADVQEPQGVPPEHQFRFQFRRFWPKVHAIYDTAITNSGGLSDEVKLLWLDADILMNQDLCVDKILGDTGKTSYKYSIPGIVCLDRGAPWGYVDSGYLLLNADYNHDGPTGAYLFIEYLHNLYTSGTIFQFREWHDAYLMSQILKIMFGPQDSDTYKANVKSLSGLSSSLHPLDESWLRSYFKHLKGSLKSEINKETKND